MPSLTTPAQTGREEELELLYEAVSDPSLWRPLLERLLCRMDGDRIVLFTGAVYDSASRTYEAVGHEPGYLENYYAHHLRVDPLTNAAYRRGLIAPGVTVLEDEVVAAEEMRRSEFVNDWLRPAGIVRRAGVTISDGRDGTLPRLTLTVHRNAGRLPFDQSTHRELQWVGRHFAGAARLRQRLENTEAERDTLGAVLDAMPHPAIVVDAVASIAFANARAETLLRDGTLLCSAERLRAADPRENDALLRAIGAACGNGGERLSAGALRVGALSRAAPLLVQVAPLPGVYGNQIGHSARLALLLIVDPAARSPDVAQRLRTVFRLSPAEVRVVSALAAGLTRAEVADQQAMSIETVATHVKRSLVKTGAQRQQELLSLVASL